MPNKPIAEPWLSFFKEIDRSLDSEILFHCFGGFAIDYLYGLPRSTSDADVIGMVIRPHYNHLIKLAGEGSALHKKFGVYLDPVGTLAVVPDTYDERLIEITPPSFNYLRLYVMEAHDIVLSKLGRNAPHDIEDVKYLAKAAKLDTAVLRERYENELKPYVIGPPERADRTLELWIEMIEEERA